MVASTDEHDPLSEEQAEKRTITAVSEDGRTLSLNEPLAFGHAAETRMYAHDEGERLVDLRAEVALLSRNVKIEGDDDSVKPAMCAPVRP